MRKIMTQLLLALEAAIEYRLRNDQPYLVKGIAADTLAHCVRNGLELNADDDTYVNTPAGRIDADAMMATIGRLMPAILR